MEALTARINEAKERISDTEDQSWKIKKLRKREFKNYWITRGEFKRYVIPKY